MRRMSSLIGLCLVSASSPLAAGNNFLQPLKAKEFLQLTQDFQASYVAGVIEGMSFVQYGYSIPDGDKWTECVRRKTLGETAAEVASLLRASSEDESVSGSLARTLGQRCKR